MTDDPLRFLILEDHAAEAELMMEGLRRSGFEFQWTRVDTEDEFRVRVLEDWDVILADFSLPQFTALEALDILGGLGVDIPFIVVTGAVGEEVAAACIKRGAADYLLKDRLARLPAAVTQALDRKRMRQETASAHRALQESEERFRTLTEHSSNGMLLLDPGGRVLQRYNDLFPADGNWFSDSFLEWMLAEDRPAVARVWDRLSEGIQTARFRISDQRGQVRWLEAVLKDLGDMPCVGAIVVRYHDVTERQQLEEQLRHSQKMQAVGQLAAGLGHDFNNLITIIRGHADLLATRADLSESPQKGLTEIQGACQKATRLTRELLTFSRKQIRDPQLLNINSIVENLAPLLRSILGEEIEFRSELEIGLGSVELDHGDLEQVILNLVTNARDASAKTASVTITTRTIVPDDLLSAQHTSDRVRPQILFSVCDTGSGMRPETVSRVFEPFFTTKDVGKGTGLGLSTVYAIVKSAGGEIFVESQIGTGTTFKIFLPVANPDSVRAASAGLNADSNSDTTILLVEDEDSVRHLIVEILEPLGCKVIATRNGNEAIRSWNSEGPPIDLLITDVRMPDVEGPELAQTLRRSQPDLKILFISGCTGAEDLSAKGLSGASFLSKPFSAETLIKNVRELLDPSPVPYSILIVDDDTQILGLLRTALEAEGYLVNTANNGKDALAQLKTCCPDVVITDLVMPEIEGIELIGMMRKVSANFKIIAMSGASDHRFYLDGALVLGADATVSKPLVMSSLLTKVRALVASRRIAEA